MEMHNYRFVESRKLRECVASDILVSFERNKGIQYISIIRGVTGNHLLFFHRRFFFFLFLFLFLLLLLFDQFGNTSETFCSISIDKCICSCFNNQILQHRIFLIGSLKYKQTGLFNKYRANSHCKLHISFPPLPHKYIL